MEEIDTFRQPLITCPYCGYKNPYSWEFAYLDDSVTIECGECEKPFFLEVHHEVSYTTVSTIATKLRGE